ncbi:unnamed protein product [Brassica napus]|uniref:(rape) hypothetical protein n=1 Tax=Brassica napus TaxID=3708 RepID=A0A816L0K9_BRANA|nr:unnamed protein product [Brassica napus]
MVTKGVSSEHGLEKEKSSYAEIVNDGSTPNVSTVVDGVADSEIPVEVFEDVEPLWKSFVVGFFMGDSRFIGSIHSTVNMIWSSPKSKIDVQFIRPARSLSLTSMGRFNECSMYGKNQLAANSSNLNEVESGDLTKSLEEGNSIDNGGSLSPGHPKHPRPVGGVESPNGFQALRDIMEEGEIVDYEEEETHQMEEDMNGEVDIIQTNKVSDKRSQKGVAVPSGEHRLSTTQAASQKGRALWREMEAVAASAVGNVYPWIVQGDFNVILPSDEHSRGTHLGTCNSAMRDFQDAIRYCGLTDLAQVGSVFTWTNRQDDVRSFQGS